ncbi:MAG: DUF3347 domain-containing protein [Bacteroidota bacterium]|nr:DUF3347 domain-containing protein [Bacteroidota bacterium]
MYIKISLIIFVSLIFSLFIFQGEYASSKDGSLTILNDSYTQSSDSTDANNIEKENTRMILSEQFDNYLLIKNSLSDNDSISAQLHASQFLENLVNLSEKIDKSNLSGNWDLFIRYAPEAKSRIASSNTLSEQRFFFGIISNFIIDLVKVYGIENYTVHILHCKDKSILGAGKWLSDANDGRNPFLGPGNEDCIEQIETKTLQ